MLLAVGAESWFALRWIGGDPQRARRLGWVVAALAGAMVAVETLAIVFRVLR
jgi:hypothetical protein